jgi:hypothetical protein
MVILEKMTIELDEDQQTGKKYLIISNKDYPAELALPVSEQQFSLVKGLKAYMNLDKKWETEK